jgi:hypothetical protein
LDDGYSYEEGKRWAIARAGLKEANKLERNVRGETGLVGGLTHWANLGLEDFRVAIGVTQAEWRKLNGMVEDISDHLSTLDLLALTYLKTAVADKIAAHRPTTYTELYDMISQIGEDVERIRRIYGPIEQKTTLRRLAKPGQKRLNGGGQ